MKKEYTDNYIAGFDWVKLLGSMLIVAFHTWLGAFVIYKKLVVYLFGIVLLFFMISGYLMFCSMKRKQKPIVYMLSYVIKYSLIYILMYLIYYLPKYIGWYIETGIFMWKDLLFVIASSLVKYNALFQLWFIPPLLCSIVIVSVVFHYNKEKQFLFGLIPLTVCSICLTTYSDIFRQIPLLETFYEINVSNYILQFLSKIVARGVLFVFAGMWIAKYRERFEKWNYKKWILPAVIFSFIEEFVLISKIENTDWIDINFLVIFWTILAFYGILHIRGTSLLKYHKMITIFSGIMYFLHVWEADILIYRIGMSHGFTVFLLITVINIFFTYLLCKIKDIYNLRIK